LYFLQFPALNDFLFLQFSFIIISVSALFRVDRNDDFGGYDPLKLIQMTAAASAQDEEGNDLDDFDADDEVEDDIDQQDEDFQVEGPGGPIRIGEYFLTEEIT
jgi:hypothetical protein